MPTEALNTVYQPGAACRDYPTGLALRHGGGLDRRRNRRLPHQMAVHTDVAKSPISTINDRVLDGMTEWQNRPLDSGCIR
jgi:hypothetical protein